MFRTHFQASSICPYTHNPVAQRSEDNSMLSITTNMLVCHVDLNLDGQEFESSGSEQERDPAHDAAAARRRVASRTTTFSMAATSSTQRINTQRTLRQCAAIPGSCALGAHHALGARHDAASTLCARTPVPALGAAVSRTARARRVA